MARLPLKLDPETASEAQGWLWLPDDDKVVWRKQREAASTQNQALNALVFLGRMDTKFGRSRSYSVTKMFRPP